MAQLKCRRGTGRSTSYGFPSHLVKAQDGETGRSVNWANPDDDGKAPEDPWKPRIFYFGFILLGV